MPLDLTSQGEQCQAVSELLVQRLLKVAISELFELKDNDWLSQTAGKDSANTMLTECSYKSSPWHALLLVALLTGNHIQVGPATQYHISHIECCTAGISSHRVP